MTKLAKRINDARRAAGFTSQEAFAVALDVDRKTPQRWESGRNTPSINALRAISQKTGYPIEFFLEAMADDEEEELVSQLAAELSQTLNRYIHEAVRVAVTKHREPVV